MFAILGGNTALSAILAATWMMAISHGDKTSLPQCFGVRSEAEFGAPRAASVLVDGTFGLRIILQHSQFLEAAHDFGHVRLVSIGGPFLLFMYFSCWGAKKWPWCEGVFNGSIFLELFYYLPFLLNLLMLVFVYTGVLYNKHLFHAVVLLSLTYWPISRNILLKQINKSGCIHRFVFCSFKYLLLGCNAYRIS